MNTTIPFAGLAPDARSVRGRGELVTFDLEAAITLGQELRGRCAGVHSARDVATAVVDAVNAFEQDRRPACVLVRAFVTRPFGRLPKEAQDALRATTGELSGDQPCMELLTSRGIEAEWNDERRSASHRAVRLGDGAAPMVAELERQLRLVEPGQPPTGTFHIVDAANSAAIPAKTFVRSYGVQAAFGFGVRAWPGETIVVIAFARTAVERKTVKAFETVARYARLLFLTTEDAYAALTTEDRMSAYADGLEQLLRLHEMTFRELMGEQKRTVASSRAATRRAVEDAAADAARHEAEMRRTQRAMLNVIEDLRDAREALATKVEVRTRELAVANRALESRNRELEEFVYIASHDLQEPLRTVGGYLQIIERRYGSKLGPEADEFIRFAIEGAQRMQALIESLLSYSRVATADRRFERCSLDEALDTALRNLALRIEETSATISRDPLPEIHADRLQMVQLFQNLVANALKFAGDAPPNVYVSSVREPGGVRIEVIDHGIGFDSRFAERIFKVFRRLRRDTPGTGIGLAICKKIAERHGGSIEASSSPGRGATFSVHLPDAATEGSA